MSVLVKEMKTSVTPRIDLVLEKIESYEENNKKMKDAMSQLSIQVDKHSKELSELRNLCQQRLEKNPKTIESSHSVPVYQSKLPQRNLERGIKRNNIIIAGIDIGTQDPKIIS